MTNALSHHCFMQTALFPVHSLLSLFNLYGHKYVTNFKCVLKQSSDVCVTTTTGTKHISLFTVQVHSIIK